MTDDKTFDDLATIQNLDYLKLPQNQSDEHLKIRAEAKVKAKELFESLKPEDRFELTVYEQSMEQSLLQKLAADNVKNAKRCPFELSQIRNVTKLFADKYDLKDPRAYVIVRALISNMLSAYRMQRYTDEAGPVIKTVDRHGTERSYLNPAEEAKRRYNEAVVDAVMKLDNIFEGSKNVHLVAGTNNPLDITALYSSLAKKSYVDTTSKPVDNKQ